MKLIFAIFVWLPICALAWSDDDWKWAGSDYGLVFFIKTDQACNSSHNSKVRVKVQNDQLVTMRVNFRVTNSEWSKQVSLDVEGGKSDSSTLISPNQPTCRAGVDQIEAHPKDPAPVAVKTEDEEK